MLNDNRIEDMALVIGMSICAILGIHYIPIILILFPTPFIILGMKNGVSRNIMNMVVTFIIIGIADSIKYGFFLLIIFLPITILLFYLIKKKKNNMEILGSSTIVFFISILIILGIINITGIDFVNELEMRVEQVIEGQIESIENMNLNSYEFLKERDLLEEKYKLSLLIIPSALFMISMIISYLNYLLISLILKKMEINIINIPKFSRFRLPNNIILGIIIMFVGVFIIEKMNIGYSNAIIINLITLIGSMFSIQGLSVVDFYLSRFNIFPAIRFIICIMLLFNSSMVLILTMIGFIDSIFDLRKIKTIS